MREDMHEMRESKRDAKKMCEGDAKKRYERDRKTNPPETCPLVPLVEFFKNMVLSTMVLTMVLSTMVLSTTGADLSQHLVLSTMVLKYLPRPELVTMCKIVIIQENTRRFPDRNGALSWE